VPFLKRTVSVAWLSLITIPVLAASTEETNRLLALRDLPLEKLQEVKVSLEDVFDVFDGLVKAQKVKVATGLPQNTAVAPAITTVITAQDIEATGARTLEEVLRMVPGLYIARFGNYTPIYTIRGMSSPLNAEVLFLVNGIPINAVLTGNRGIWGEMVPPVENLARIEVIRGPGSALYGADAYAGVINLITKSASEMEGTQAGLRGGSYDSQTGWVMHGGTWGPFEVATSVHYSHTDGHHPQIDTDSQSLLDISPAAKKQQPTYQPASLAPAEANLKENKLSTYLDLRQANWQLRLNYQEVTDRGIGVHFLSIDPWGDGNNQTYGGDLTWYAPQFSTHWDLETRLTYQHGLETANFWRNPPGAFVSANAGGAGGIYPKGVQEQYELATQRWNLQVSGLYAGLVGHKVRVGSGYTSQELYHTQLWSNRGVNAAGQPLPLNSPLVDLSDSPYAAYPQVDRSNWHVFAQDSWLFTDGWELTTGLRYDYYSEQTQDWQTTNPRIALVWQTTPRLTSKFLYGRAFRAPTFRELYLPVGVISGNPNLEPETINTYELAFDYQAKDNLHLGLNLFHYEANDKISRAPLTKGIATYKNMATWKGQGFELETRWKLGNDASVLFNYAYVHDEETNGSDPVHDVGNYPHHLAYLRTDWMFAPHWFLDTQVKFTKDRQRAYGDSRPPIADYTTVDLTLHYKDVRNTAWGLAIGLRNLFDRDIREPSLAQQIPYDYPQAKRHWFVELNYQF